MAAAAEVAPTIPAAPTNGCKYAYHPPMVCYNVESLPSIDKEFYSRLANSKHELVQVSKCCTRTSGC
jgi:hypothetical protein